MTTLAQLGGWCFRRRGRVLAAWLVVAVAGAVLTGPVFASLSDIGDFENVESIDALRILEKVTGSAGQVLVLVDGVDPRDPAVVDRVRATAADLTALPGLRGVTDPYVADGMIRPHAVLLTADLSTLDRPDHNATVDRVKARADRLAHDLLAAGQPDAEVLVGGDPVLNREIPQRVHADVLRAEALSLPLTLVVLVIVFGGLIVAGLPVLAAVAAVAAAMPVLVVFSTVITVNVNAVTVVSLMGMGLSIDYGLLLVARFREERDHGHDAETAVARAWATAGRTVTFSALTVAAALTGLLMFDPTGLSQLGAAGVAVAGTAMLAALTLVPALLGLTHRWIRPRSRRRRLAPDRRRLAPDRRRLAPSPRRPADRGFFGWLSRLVQRHPLPVFVLTGGALLAAGLPLLSATVRLPQLTGLPPDMASVQVVDRLASDFGMSVRPDVTVVAATDRATVEGWAARWAGDPAVERTYPVRERVAGVFVAGFELTGDGQSAAAQDLVHRMRADRPGGRSWVTGDAAILVDVKSEIRQGFPAAATVSLLSVGLLLFAMTGSLLIPVKAIVANVVSLGATFGVMTAVFAHGHGAGVLHTLTVGGLDPFVLVIVFAFAFGLSLDYEMFLLGRIREYVDRGADSDTAVRRGLQHTGRVITSAALLMVVVFGCFAAARVGSIEQIGVGLTVAVVVDATIVRCLLVPATMTLLGSWNWWLPRPLRRLHGVIALRENPSVAGRSTRTRPPERPPRAHSMTG